jgi:DNA-binding NarL/FixJ family response regulator
MSGPCTITTILISRDHILRLGVRNILARQHIRLIDPPADMTDMDTHLARTQPQAIILDAGAEPDLRGFITKIRACVPKGKIILLMGSEDTTCNWESLSSGVDGVVLKRQPPEALIACIEDLCGLSSIPAPCAYSETPRANPASQDADNGFGSLSSCHRHPSLTEREREVLELIAFGLSNKDIADRLCISVTTVRHHLTSIFDKLGVTTRQKLLVRALQYGLVSLPVSSLS